MDISRRGFFEVATLSTTAALLARDVPISTHFAWPPVLAQTVAHRLGSQNSTIQAALNRLAPHIRAPGGLVSPRPLDDLSASADERPVRWRLTNRDGSRCEKINLSQTVAVVGGRLLRVQRDEAISLYGVGGCTFSGIAVLLFRYRREGLGMIARVDDLPALPYRLDILERSHREAAVGLLS